MVISQAPPSENVCVTHNRRGLAFSGLGLPTGRPQTEHHLSFTYSLAFPRDCGVPALSSPQQGERRLEPCGRCGLCHPAAGRLLLLKEAVTFRRRTALFAFRGPGRPAEAPGRRRSGVLSFPKLVANSARTAQEVAALPLRRACSHCRSSTCRSFPRGQSPGHSSGHSSKQEARPRPRHLLA